MGLFGPPNVGKMEIKLDVKGLIKALGYMEDKTVRQAAIDALGRIGDACAVEPLIAIFNDEDENLHQGAAEALGSIGALAIEPLIVTLKNNDWRVSKAAVQALVKIGTPAIGLLIAALKDIDKNVCKAAAEALGRVGDARAIEPLIVALKGDMRKAATKALGRIGTPAIEPIIAELNDEDPRTRLVAIDVLLEIGNSRAIEILTTALKDKDKDVRQASAKALDVLGWKPGKDVNAAYYWVVKDNWKKCVTLGSAAVEPLISALEDKSGYIWHSVVDTLGKIGDPRAIEPLIAILKDGNSPGRWIAVEALREIGNASAIEPLITVLRDKEEHVRKAAAVTLDALGWKPERDVTAVQYWIAKENWDKCITLGSVAVEPLIVELEGIKVYYAAETLGKIGDPRAVEPLIAVLKDDWPMRGVAATALGKIGDTRAIEPLISVLNDNEYSYRIAAAEALKALGWKPDKK